MICYECKKPIVKEAMFCQKCYNDLIKRKVISEDDPFFVHETKCSKCQKKIPCTVMICKKCYNELKIKSKKINDFSISTLYRVKNISKQNDFYDFDLIEWKTEKYPEIHQKKVHLKLQAKNKPELIEAILYLRRKRSKLLQDLAYSYKV